MIQLMYSIRWDSVYKCPLFHIHGIFGIFFMTINWKDLSRNEKDYHEIYLLVSMGDLKI